MLIDTSGPWHHGFAITTEVLGEYVTIVCCSAGVASAIAEAVGTGVLAGPELAYVGRVAGRKTEHAAPAAPQVRRRGLL